MWKLEIHRTEQQSVLVSWRDATQCDVDIYCVVMICA